MQKIVPEYLSILDVKDLHFKTPGESFSSERLHDCGL